MKKLYYLKHAGSGCVFRERLTEDELNKMLNTDAVDLINATIYKKRIAEGYDSDY